MNVLMLSSSKYAQHDYLAYAHEWIDQHLANCKNVLFIPYAGVSLNWDSYTQKVQQALPHFNISGIHEHDSPASALKQCDAILVGGGNTFNLLHQLYANDIIELIQNKVQKGTPYIGWSAGGNICGQSISTTNDMPIIEPASFTALAFLPVQLNPHYTDYIAPNHHGETRDQRLEEFCILHPSMPVLAIREGSALLMKKNHLRLLGELGGFVFQGVHKNAIQPGQDLSEYL